MAMGDGGCGLGDAGCGMGDAGWGMRNAGRGTELEGAFQIREHAADGITVAESFHEDWQLDITELAGQSQLYLYFRDRSTRVRQRILVLTPRGACVSFRDI